MPRSLDKELRTRARMLCKTLIKLKKLGSGREEITKGIATLKAAIRILEAL